MMRAMMARDAIVRARILGMSLYMLLLLVCYCVDAVIAS
jgi:hypothetical protein